jgi:hypothetical protein
VGTDKTTAVVFPIVSLPHYVQTGSGGPATSHQ